MLGDRDLERVADLVQESATAELLSRFRRLGPGDIREKSPGDLVTVADLACERRLAAGLALILPGAPVVGEEAVAAEPGLLSHIAEAELAWIVDPLDGTSNFARGHDRFAVIVALARRGETVAAWIHDPVRGRMAVGSLGGGVRFDGKTSELPPAPPLKDTNGFVGYKFKREVVSRLGPDALSRLGGLTTFGCAGLEYLETLNGRSHFSLYRWTKPWDHAAGALLVREAGGIANRHDGAPYAPTQRVDAGILVASDEGRWRELYELLMGAPAPLLDGAGGRGAAC
ncbi:MAG: inositol monophosphatase [Rhodospirillales bacterium]|nr:MAG: inositol monophosphatase [Rhodospirillales bacterium]